MSCADGRYSALWWWSLAVGLAGGLYNCRDVGAAFFSIGANDNAISIFVAKVSVLTIPLVVLAARFPRGGGVGLIVIAGAAMLGCIPFTVTGVGWLFEIWLLLFVPTMLAGAGFWLSSRRTGPSTPERPVGDEPRAS